MSVAAISYVVSLRVCPDGAPLKAAQKALLFVLADAHNAHHKTCWPSIPLLAEQSHLSLSTTKREMKYFRDHGLLDVRVGRGAGNFSEYRFMELDGRFDQADKRVQPEPFFCPAEKGSKRVQNPPEKGSKRVQNDHRNKEEPRTVEPRTVKATASVEKSAWDSLHPMIADKLIASIRTVRDMQEGISRHGWTPEQFAAEQRDMILRAAERAGVWREVAERLALEMYDVTLAEERARV
jgi:hypothetical protein